MLALWYLVVNLYLCINQRIYHKQGLQVLYFVNSTLINTKGRQDAWCKFGDRLNTVYLIKIKIAVSL